MEQIIKSSSLESTRSVFVVTLAKHSKNEKLYVSIRQTVTATNVVQKIDIHPFILSEIIELLIQYKSEIETVMPIILPARTYLTEEKENEMVQRYLKGGLDIRDLKLQFNCPEHVIKQILIGKGIVIVRNNKDSKGYRWRAKKKKKNSGLKEEDLPRSGNSKYIQKQVQRARAGR